MKTIYDIYNDLIVELHGISANEDRLSVPQIIKAIDDAILCSEKDILKLKTYDAFGYKLRSIEDYAKTCKNYLDLARYINNKFDFSNPVKFILSQQYSYELTDFISMNYPDINYIMTCLANYVSEILYDKQEEEDIEASNMRCITELTDDVINKLMQIEGDADE